MKYTKSITRAGVIAALYIVLTMAFYFSSFSAETIQIRPSEALMVLPLLMWEAIPGLWIGCMLANIMFGNIIDIFFGSLATLIAAALTYLVGRIFKRNTPLRLIFGLIPPIIVNAIMVPMTFTIFIGNAAVYWLEFTNILIGESIVVIALGIPLYFGVRTFIKKLNKNKDL